LGALPGDSIHEERGLVGEALNSLVLDTMLGKVHIEWRNEDLAFVRLDALERKEGTSYARVTEGCAPDDKGEITVQNLVQYFSGKRTSIGAHLHMADYTPFQRAVWEETRDIPYGETRTYGGIAEAIGRPGSVRATGAALDKNPWPVVIPCHRVVGANGDLTGFAYGIGWKSALL
jgi:methylated-DNA-[protein]-cysteine S-methyltransferase